MEELFIITTEDELTLALKRKNAKKHARNNKLLEFRKSRGKSRINYDPIGSYTQYKKTGKWNGCMSISWRKTFA